MNSAQVRNAYRQSESQSKINPVKLIHMMYERVLQHLDGAKVAIEAGNIQERGENLGKVIALVTELNASIKDDDASDAANFLRGLYGAILTELPKVSLSEDTQILIQAQTYIERLKDVWEKTAMQEYESDLHGQGQSQAAAVSAAVPQASAPGKPPVSPGLSVAI